MHVVQVLKQELGCRIPARCGPAAGVKRQSGEPEQSPDSGEGSCGPRQQDGSAPGECRF